MAVCTKCGAQVADGLLNCPVCGTSVQMMNQSMQGNPGMQGMHGGYGAQGTPMQGNPQMSGGYGMHGNPAMPGNPQVPGGYGMQMPPKKSHAGLIAGIIAAVAVVALVVVILAVFVFNGNKDDDGNTGANPTVTVTPDTPSGGDIPTAAPNITDAPPTQEPEPTQEPTETPIDISATEQGKSGYQEVARIYLKGYEDMNLDTTVSVYPSKLREAIKEELIYPYDSEEELWSEIAAHYGNGTYITSRMGASRAIDESDFSELEEILLSSYDYDCHISEGVLQAVELTIHYGSGGADDAYLLIYCVKINGSWFAIGAEDTDEFDFAGREDESEEEYLRIARDYVSCIADMNIEYALEYCHPVIRDDVRAAFGGMTQEQAWERLYSAYGNDVTTYYEIGEATHIESDELSQYEMLFLYQYDCECTITDGYIISFTMGYEGSKGSDENSGDLYMLEIDGVWYALG